MPEFSFPKLSQSDFRRQTFVAVVTSVIIPLLPFLFLRCIMFFLPSGMSSIVPDALIGDFAIIGVGIFFGNVVGYATAMPLEGWNGVGTRTVVLMVMSGAGAIVCWGGYQALALTVGGVISAQMDHDHAKNVLYVAVPFSAIFSVSFYVSHVRDQILRHEEKVLFSATGGLVRGSTVDNG